MERYYLALAALVGGIATALVGWLEGQEPFDNRKFCASAIRALFAGVIFALTYQLAEEFSPVDLLWAFLGGAGVDALGNRISSKFGNAQWPLKKRQKKTVLPPTESGPVR